MPRSSRALLPAEIRTVAGRNPRGPMLSWDLTPVRGHIRQTRNRHAGLGFPRDGCLARGRSNRHGSREREAEGRLPKKPTDPFRATTRTCPRSLPTTVMSRRLPDRK
jgi:hypothetical protein